MKRGKMKPGLNRGRAVGTAMMFFALLGLSAQEEKTTDSSARTGVNSFQGISSAVLRRDAVDDAYNFLGTPYLLAGGDYSGIDCSGLTKTVLDKKVPDSLPRQVIQQIETGKSVSGPLLPGDMIFFNTTGVPSHVGIYSGDRRVVHAASAGSRTGVIESSLDEPYYQKRIVEARRVIPHSTPTLNLSFLDSADEVLRLTAPSPAGTWIAVSWSNPRSTRELYELEIRQGERVHKISRHPSDGGDSFQQMLYQPEGEGYTVILRGIIQGKKVEARILVPILRKKLE